VRGEALLHTYVTSISTFPVAESLSEDDGWVRMLVQFLVSERDGGASKLVFGRTVMPPGARHDVHRHDGADEVVFVLEGRGLVRNGEEEIALEAGQVVFSPQGEWHGFWNNTSEPATLIWVWGGAGSIETAGYSVARPSPWSADKEGRA